MARVRVMGIVNVTPDSFSGDGLDPQRAIGRGLGMLEAGADILDVGGESTRPGHVPVSPAEEMRRALPVVEALARAGATVSIDTYKEEVARAAVEAGAAIVNDIWGLRRSPGIATLAAERGLGLVLMHNQDGTAYPAGLMETIKGELRRSVAAAVAAGVLRERVVVDPGIGFGKTPEQNVVVLRRLAELAELGQPVLLGASRKSVYGRVFGLQGEARVWGTAAALALAVARGVDIVRVHDVPEMVAVVRVAEGLW